MTEIKFQTLSLLANHVNHNVSREEALYLIKHIFIAIGVSLLFSLVSIWS
jgi:hypothetical protein